MLISLKDNLLWIQLMNTSKTKVKTNHKYEVTVCHVDYPMGSSPEYNINYYTTKEEAEAKAKEFNDAEDVRNPGSNIYKSYNVRLLKHDCYCFRCTQGE